MGKVYHRKKKEGKAKPVVRPTDDGFQGFSLNHEPQKEDERQREIQSLS